MGNVGLALERRRLRGLLGFRKRALSPAMDAMDAMELGGSGGMAELPMRADGVAGVCVTVLGSAIYQQCPTAIQLQRRDLSEQSCFMGEILSSG